MNKKQINVLIVEDSIDDTLLIERELKNGGFLPSISRVDKLTDVESALQLSRWDIVISDHSLPGLSSEAVLEVVRENHANIPFFIVSGSIVEDAAALAMSSGASDYIMKNNLTRLVPAINRELRDAETRQAHMKAQAIIRHLAHHDMLTGLHNRSVLEDKISSLLHEPEYVGLQHVLLYIDLDQFKIVNDTLGHLAGDELIKRIAELIQANLHDTDLLSRLGGDEFGIVLENCEIAQAVQLADRLLQGIEQFRFVWSGKKLPVSVSIGLVQFSTRSYRSMAAVFSAADLACHTAKDLGRNRIHVYHENEANILQRQSDMQWLAAINDALEHNRFCLYQQKIFRLADKSDGYFIEYLLRMRNPHGILVSPNAFISAAERYNLMHQIDSWVISNAFASFKSMQQQNTPAEMAFINLSGTSLSNEKILNLIKHELRCGGINPQQICFEVTETAAITNLPTAIVFIQELKQLGFRFALDDFGVGLSSFSYLKSLPVDFLKVDGGFIRDMLNDPMDAAIVESINHVGHVAGLHTIAEYVESELIASRLTELGFDFAQGFALHSPESSDLHERWPQLA